MTWRESLQWHRVPSVTRTLQNSDLSLAGDWRI